jgi:hypothetical protein
MVESFVVPFCCICLIRFHFDAIISVYLFCLLDNDKFYVWLNVHLAVLCNENQLDPPFIFNLLRHSTSTCFGHIQ